MTSTCSAPIPEDPRESITGLSWPALAEEMERRKEPHYRARQIWEWLYEKGAEKFSDMSNLPGRLRHDLEENFDLPAFHVERFESRDGSIKFRLRLSDGATIEMVWIPEGRRKTLCVSSQAGCALACAFCVTGAVGFTRNLSVAEIVDQVRYVKGIARFPLTNLVFMGMGEPLLNPENVVAAIEIITSIPGLGIGKRKITVSTAGIVPNIIPFFEATDVKLAISLTGAADVTRDHWMPINRKYNLDVLMRELRKLRLRKGRYVTFEVVLMSDRNDTLEEAEKLVELFRGIPARVNLIPYNENPFFPELRRPTLDRVRKFQTHLMERGIPSLVRKNRGEDILGACGQLAGADTKEGSAQS